MARSRQMGAPKRTTRIPARGTTLAAADRLLLAAQEARDEYDRLTLGYNALPRRRFIRRRHAERDRLLAAVRHMQAIRAAQDIAKKGKEIEL